MTDVRLANISSELDWKPEGGKKYTRRQCRMEKIHKRSGKRVKQEMLVGMPMLTFATLP
jgi:hypothetical protein